MSMDIKGRLIQVLPLQSGTSKSGNGWSKQEFVIETEEQFPKKVCFTLFGDKVSLLNGLAVGSQVEVAFNLESREFNGKWYSNINAWKLNPVQNQASPSSSGSDYSPEDIPPPSDPYTPEAYNDLPF
jgi:hypothetical protein